MANTPKAKLYGKLLGKNGISRMVAILLILVLVMLVVVSIPVYKYYKAYADNVACVQSLDSAWRQIAVDYLSNNPDPTPEEVNEDSWWLDETSCRYLCRGWLRREVG